MRIDEDVKAQSQSLLAELGMDVTTYLTLALKQLIREQALPFQPSINKGKTMSKDEAFKSIEDIVNSKTITNPNIDYKAELSSYRNEKYGK
jgi:DNA-damage-inducible protein J